MEFFEGIFILIIVFLIIVIIATFALRCICELWEDYFTFYYDRWVENKKDKKEDK